LVMMIYNKNKKLVPSEKNGERKKKKQYTPSSTGIFGNVPPTSAPGLLVNLSGSKFPSKTSL
jgi:hypothetical protein